MKTLFAIFSLFIFASGQSLATSQMPDTLTIDGDKQSMNCNPLEGYFEKNPDKRPKSNIQCSNLWRGYVAHFVLRKDELWVKDIEINVRKEGTKRGDFTWHSVLKDVFPNKVDRKATWFTGFLILPRGNITNYVHMGYASSYEAYRLLFVHNGKVQADRIFSAEEYGEYKNLQFEAFSKTERYKKMKKELDEQYGNDPFLNPEGFLYAFDVTFPRETLIDYKDFRPNK